MTNPETGIRGDDEDLKRRREAFGINNYHRRPPKSFFYFVVGSLKDPTILILLVCASLSLAFGIKEEGPREGWYDGGSIFIAVFMVVIVSAVTNFRQSRQFNELSKVSNNIQIDVVRNGRRQRISIFDIVVGDVVCLKIGDQIPADGIFLDGHSLQVDESSMTGESDHVEINKDVHPFLVSGAKVVDGYGQMLVTSVGMNTSWGEMMSSISHDNNEQTPLQVRLNKLTSAIGKVGSVVALSYNAIPEGLPLAVTLTLAYSMKRMMADQAMVRRLSALTDFKLGKEAILGNIASAIHPNILELPTEKAILSWAKRSGALVKKKYYDKSGVVKTLNKPEQEGVMHQIEGMASQALRCIAFAHSPVEVAHQNLVEDNLIFLGVVGLKDPCRPSVKEAIDLCRKAGVQIKMITGDNILTARAIALECGILDPAKSSPSDKLLMIQSLKKKGEVVAVTGDGTNDAPALKEANFIQFQLTVNVAALVINFVAACSAGEVPLTAVQLLWVNLIMDTLGALALATDRPTDELMDRPPIGWKEPLVTNVMWRNLIFQALYQIIVLLTLQFKGRSIFKLERKNVFQGILKNRLFLSIVAATIILQVLMVELLRKFADTERLNWMQWGICTILASLSWPLAWVVKCIPSLYFHIRFVIFVSIMAMGNILCHLLSYIQVIIHLMIHHHMSCNPWTMNQVRPTRCQISLFACKALNRETHSEPKITLSSSSFLSFPNLLTLAIFTLILSSSSFTQTGFLCFASSSSFAYPTAVGFENGTPGGHALHAQVGIGWERAQASQGAESCGTAYFIIGGGLLYTGIEKSLLLSFSSLCLSQDQLTPSQPSPTLVPLLSLFACSSPKKSAYPPPCVSSPQRTFSAQREYSLPGLHFFFLSLFFHYLLHMVLRKRKLMEIIKNRMKSWLEMMRKLICYVLKQYTESGQMAKFLADDRLASKPHLRWRFAFIAIYFTKVLDSLSKRTVKKSIPVLGPGVLSSRSYLSIDVQDVHEDDSGHGRSGDEHVLPFRNVGQRMLTEMVRDKDLERLRQFGGVKQLPALLGTNEKNGIDGHEADLIHRRNVFGSNEYTKPPKKGFLSPREGWYDGGSIIFSSESSDIRVQVVRQGRRQPVSIFQLVVGDIVFLNIGDQVPADGLFMEGHSLKVDESSMTGESDHVEINEKENPFMFSGTKVSDGFGTMLVTSVGMNTAWGEMMSSIRKLGLAIDNGLPMAVTLTLAYSMRRMMTDQALVRKLSACETMGSVTTICTDKTGTLTLNKMKVVEFWLEIGLNTTGSAFNSQKKRNDTSHVKA
ncbi:unnamed protein product, partial [Vitis vinifera]